MTEAVGVPCKDYGTEGLSQPEAMAIAKMPHIISRVIQEAIKFNLHHIFNREAGCQLGPAWKKLIQTIKQQEDVTHVLSPQILVWMEEMQPCNWGLPHSPPPLPSRTNAYLLSAPV